MAKDIKILISSCLFGDKVRYDGKGAEFKHYFLKELLEKNQVIKCCPEILAGFHAPRKPAEIRSKTGCYTNVVDLMVVQNDGIDVTDKFLLGAKKTLEIVLKNGIRMAILKDKSPSCGSVVTYDGTFSGKLIPGRGILSLLLMENNIAVFPAEHMQEAIMYYNNVILKE